MTAAAAADTTIPESVTLPGEVVAGLMVSLLSLEEDYLFNHDSGDGLEPVDKSLQAAFTAAFGAMYRACENADCTGCTACNGTEEEAATPIYGQLLGRAKSDFEFRRNAEYPDHESRSTESAELRGIRGNIAELRILINHLRRELRREREETRS